MLNDLPMIMVRCLVLTILIEGGAALIFGVRDKKDLLNVVLVNVLTNPAVVVSTFIVGFFCGSSVRTPVEIAEEISVVFIEGFIYYKTLNYKKLNGFLLALILNAISYASGFLINMIF